MNIDWNCGICKRFIYIRKFIFAGINFRGFRTFWSIQKKFVSQKNLKKGWSAKINSHKTFKFFTFAKLISIFDLMKIQLFWSLSFLIKNTKKLLIWFVVENRWSALLNLIRFIILTLSQVIMNLSRKLYQTLL